MNFKNLLIIGMLLCDLFVFNSFAFGQGTAFTYQGRLDDGANPANGTYDLTFSLFNTNTGGSVVAGPITNSATGITNGLFIATLDFGGVFNGQNYWLDISVRTNGNGAFTKLNPRQPLTPAPYAIFANTASNLLGTLPAAQLSGTLATVQLPANVVTNGASGLNLTGTFSGNGAGLTSLSASQLTSGTVSDSVLSPDVSKNPDAYTVAWTTNSNPYSSQYYNFNAVQSLTNQSGVIHWLSCNPTLYLLSGFLPSVTGSATPGESPTLGFEFGVNGDDFTIGLAGQAFNIQVNEGPVATYTAAYNLGELYFRVKFNSVANRLVRIEGMGLQVVELLTLNTNGIVRRSVANTKIVFVGDSKVNGANSVNPQDTWPYDYAKTHPNVDVWEDAVGGTGLVNPGSYTNYQGRIFSDFTNNFSAYIVSGSVNDGGYPSNQIYSAAFLLFQTIKSNAPCAFIGCVLAVDAGTPISAGVTNSTYAIRRACLDNAVPFIDPGGSGTNLPPGANPWITGNYNIAGNGNAYLYVSSDGVHPSLAGHSFIEQNIDDFVTASVFQTINPLNANLTGVFTGNGGGLTNLSPQNITTINSPVNGYALRYTNGVFYWAP